MINKENTLQVTCNKKIYNLSHWQNYRTHLSDNIVYPDLFRLTYDKYHFEVLIGLKLNYKDYVKYKNNPESCIWKVYTEDVDNDFKFIEKWYKDKYGTIEVSYDQMKLAAKRIDDLLLKFNNLKIFI